MTILAQETIKAVVARYNPDQLITQREKVSAEIKQILITKAKEFNIILDDVAILHIEFSKEYRDAIEAKQVSQQMAAIMVLILVLAVQIYLKMAFWLSLHQMVLGHGRHLLVEMDMTL